jgi:hypothetical protein
MTKRIWITIVIIAAIGVGTGTLIMGILMMNTATFSGGDSDKAAFVAIGSGILASSLAALVAHLHGAFRSLDEPDDDPN